MKKRIKSKLQSIAINVFSSYVWTWSSKKIDNISKWTKQNQAKNKNSIKFLQKCYDPSYSTPIQCWYGNVAFLVHIHHLSVDHAIFLSRVMRQIKIIRINTAQINNRNLTKITIWILFLVRGIHLKFAIVSAK